MNFAKMEDPRPISARPNTKHIEPAHRINAICEPLGSGPCMILWRRSQNVRDLTSSTSGWTVSSVPSSIIESKKFPLELWLRSFSFISIWSNSLYLKDVQSATPPFSCCNENASAPCSETDELHAIFFESKLYEIRLELFVLRISIPDDRDPIPDLRVQRTAFFAADKPVHHTLTILKSYQKELAKA